jgi:hypothetical protein
MPLATEKRLPFVFCVGRLPPDFTQPPAASADTPRMHDIAVYVFTSGLVISIRGGIARWKWRGEVLRERRIAAC